MAAAGCGRIVLTSRSQPNHEGAGDNRAHPGDRMPTSSSSAATSPRPALRTGWWQRQPPPGFRCAACCTRRRWSRTPPWPTSPTSCIDRDWAPKVYGAWNLHQATAGQPLDWFCSFSSAAALLGSPGQGAYAAANSWLDAFTHWRRAQGLPATAIAWGAWAEIGRAAALAESGDTTMITPDEGAYAFEALLRHDRAYTGYAPIIGTPWLTALAQRSRFAELFQSAGKTDRAQANSAPS